MQAWGATDSASKPRSTSHFKFRGQPFPGNFKVHSTIALPVARPAVRVGCSLSATGTLVVVEACQWDLVLLLSYY